jgi:hypothetical protein
MENTNENEMSPAQSLAVINAMINTAKQRLADDGFYFILWGWLVFTASLWNYIGILMQSELGGWGWMILLPMGGLVSLVYGWRQNKKEKVRTYIDTYLAYCWTAFAIVLAATLIFMGMNGFRSTYFFLMLLYGMATMISGGLLNFKPLVIGSVFSFVFAVCAMFVQEKELLLCIAGALLCSYIVPGHLLKSKFKSQEHV